eukprot:CAMPEP_0172189090 /NCGR_PEP_ID=MMETSP1050-20130122/22323_1 /TAXON_ID=233186 /ORGANISM="Cryptomonas curvata, Strain CCAP979/52" /LENGTH=154 /DNA_ID=CAMNT_0012863731 /DNA_START=181 /DNA_END=645 /DNA_ORIENTATION=+
MGADVGVGLGLEMSALISRNGAAATNKAAGGALRAHPHDEHGVVAIFGAAVVLDPRAEKRLLLAGVDVLAADVHRAGRGGEVAPREVVDEAALEIVAHGEAVEQGGATGGQHGGVDYAVPDEVQLAERLKEPLQDGPAAGSLAPQHIVTEMLVT